jgi:hypothetical protein
VVDRGAELHAGVDVQFLELGEAAQPGQRLSGEGCRPGVGRLAELGLGGAGCVALELAQIEGQAVGFDHRDGRVEQQLEQQEDRAVERGQVAQQLVGAQIAQGSLQEPQLPGGALVVLELPQVADDCPRGVEAQPACHALGRARPGLGQQGAGGAQGLGHLGAQSAMEGQAHGQGGGGSGQVQRTRNPGEEHVQRPRTVTEARRLEPLGLGDGLEGRGLVAEQAQVVLAQAVVLGKRSPAIRRVELEPQRAGAVPAHIFAAAPRARQRPGAHHQYIVAGEEVELTVLAGTSGFEGAAVGHGGSGWLELPPKLPQRLVRG